MILFVAAFKYISTTVFHILLLLTALLTTILSILSATIFGISFFSFILNNWIELIDKYKSLQDY